MKNNIILEKLESLRKTSKEIFTVTYIFNKKSNNLTYVKPITRLDLESQTNESILTQLNEIKYKKQAIGYYIK